MSEKKNWEVTLSYVTRKHESYLIRNVSKENIKEVK